MSGRRPEHGQNFLRSRRLARDLLDKTSITSDDLVLEIGAGRGALTEPLAARCRHVIAYEADSRLCRSLERRLRTAGNLTLRAADFLESQLPGEPHKVFANVPFNITADVVAKLTSGVDPPLDVYLIVQREAAERYAITPDRRSTLIACLMNPRWDIRVLAHIPRTEFGPRPKVDAALLRLRRRRRPLIESAAAAVYADLVTHAYSSGRRTLKQSLRPVLTARQLGRLSRDLGFEPHQHPAELRPDQWLGLARFVLDRVAPSKRRLIAGASARLETRRRRLTKWHRARFPLPVEGEG